MYIILIYMQYIHENVGAGRWVPSLGPGQLRIPVTFSSPTATNSTGYAQHIHNIVIQTRGHTLNIYMSYTNMVI